MKKAKKYCELAAIGGNVRARHNLGIAEENAHNKDKALRHYMIAVRDGSNDSLKEIHTLYMNGDATKDDYAKALGAYQTYLREIESDQRNEAAAANDLYQYIESGDSADEIIAVSDEDLFKLWRLSDLFDNIAIFGFRVDIQTMLWNADL